MNSDDSKQAERLLEGAYALKSADDNVDYYRQFAPLYDEQFASALGYSYPQRIAGEFLQRWQGERLPVIDIGCGTGLVAEHLVGCEWIEGVDISKEMLAVAKQKSIYRLLHCIDLKTEMHTLPEQYAGVISAGTFTHGHLGAEVMDQLLGIAQSGALFCIGINAEHYRSAGFDAVVKRWLSEQSIYDLEQSSCQIYSDSTGEHAADIADILVFRKV